MALPIRKRLAKTQVRRRIEACWSTSYTGLLGCKKRKVISVSQEIVHEEISEESSLGHIFNGDYYNMQGWDLVPNLFRTHDEYQPRISKAGDGVQLNFTMDGQLILHNSSVETGLNREFASSSVLSDEQQNTSEQWDDFLSEAQDASNLHQDKAPHPASKAT